MSKGIVWKDWNPQRVKDHVKEEVAESMEAACVTVEIQARKNLMGIEEPEKWKKYRRRFLAHWIRHEVEVGDNFVEGRVGVSTESKYQRGGYFIEIGRAKLSAHPWLRPAVFNNAREILRILTGKG